MEDIADVDVAEAAEPPKTASSKPAKAAEKPARPHWFPRPARFKLKGLQFFHYWKNLTPECQGRAMVYVYSVWPVLNSMQALTPEEQREVEQQKRRAPPTNIDKPDAPFDADEWETEVLRRYGGGTYHIKLNDSGVPSNAQFPPKNICTTDFELQHPDFPPVRDWGLLDMAHPANQSLIVQLRARGIRLPGDELRELEEREVDEMAQVQSIEKLTDAVVSMAKEQAKPQTQQPNAQGLADSKAVESVAAGAQQGFKILGDAMARATELQGKASDPIETIRALKEVAGILAPQQSKSDDGALLQMMKMQHETHLAEMKAMNDRLASRGNPERGPSWINSSASSEQAA